MKQVEIFWKCGTNKGGQRDRFLQKTWATSKFKRQSKCGKQNCTNCRQYNKEKSGSHQGEMV